MSYLTDQQQFRYAAIVGAMLGLVGLLTIGLSFGLAIGAQTLQTIGCPPPGIVITQPCQKGMQVLHGRAITGSLVGVASLLSGGAILYYLRRYVP